MENTSSPIEPPKPLVIIKTNRKINVKEKTFENIIKEGISKGLKKIVKKNNPVVEKQKSQLEIAMEKRRGYIAPANRNSDSDESDSDDSD